MNPEILKLMVQLPSAGILCVTVWMFLKHLASQNAALIEFYKAMHRDHITHAEESNRVVQQLVAATEKNISVTSRNTYVLETILAAFEKVVTIPKMPPNMPS